MTRYSKFIIVCSTLLLGFGHASFATTHHTPLEPASAAPESAGWQEARIWFLPDWQRDTRSYNSNTSNDTGGGDNPDVVGKCGTYGFVQSCASPKVSTGSVKPYPGLTCQKSCTCPSSYQYTSSNCSGDRQVGGSSCDGKYNQCNLKPCPTAVSCDYGCQTYSSMSHCSSICTECKTDPCPGYYECGGTWQYCTGSKCSTDSSKCSVYCASDYFPYSCGSDYGPCYGVYRNGYCSVSCDKIETDPCSGVSCGSNASCSGGSCYCNSGYEGNAYSGCTKTPTDPCAGVSCPSGQTCANGSCVSNCPTSSSCSYGCQSYSSQSGCSSVCISCKSSGTYCSEQGYSSSVSSCPAGQTLSSCSANSSYKKCTGSTCPSSQSCTYGCQTYSSQSGCSNVCTGCYSDNCRNRTAKTCSYGCQSNYSDCSSKCETCYADNCRNRTAKTCSYGCQSNYSDCSSKCETCYADNCRNRTAVSIPANASCSSYFSDCSSKCQAWSCNSGYTQSGSSCVAASCSYTTMCPGATVPSPTKCQCGGSPCTACGITKYKCNSPCLPELACDGVRMSCGGKSCCCPTGQCYDSRGANMCDCDSSSM